MIIIFKSFYRTNFQNMALQWQQEILIMMEEKTLLLVNQAALGRKLFFKSQMGDLK